MGADLRSQCLVVPNQKPVDGCRRETVLTCNPARMDLERVFVGTEALDAGVLTPYQRRARYRRLLPDVYGPKWEDLSLEDRAVAGWLWSKRQGVLAGLTAAGLLGAKWVPADSPIELILPNNKSPAGVTTRNDTLLDDELHTVLGLPVTTATRTAFDLARGREARMAVARLDALARATQFCTADVLELASRHPHIKGLRRVPVALDLIDSGAESLRESLVRMVLVEEGFPRPETQIPVVRPDGESHYYLDMGWRWLKIAIEYDGDHHRADPHEYRRGIIRQEYLQSQGWIVVRVIAGMGRAEIAYRVRQAWAQRAQLGAAG